MDRVFRKDEWNAPYKGEGVVGACWERNTFLIMLLVKSTKKKANGITWPLRFVKRTGMVCHEDLFPHHTCPGILFNKLDLKDVPSQGKRYTSRIALQTETTVQMGLFFNSCLT